MVRMLHRVVLIFAFITALAGTTRADWAGAILEASESFETDPGTGYTLNTAFDDGGFDFFGRYAAPDATNAARDDFVGGFGGSFAIFGQDHDGDGGPATVDVTVDPVDVTGLADLGVRVALGALDSEPDFDNYEAADGDGIDIYADLGAGAFLVGAFRPNATGASDLYQDTNLDGTGDGANLTTTLTDFDFLIPGSGSALSIRIDLTSTSSFEPLTLDNVRIYSSVPEPGTFALTALGSACIALFYRRRAREQG